MCFGGGGDAGSAARESQQRQLELVNQAEQKINSNFAQFTPEFYNQRAKAYERFATPQLGEQYNTVGQQLKFGLANRGLLGGSVGRQKQNSLQREMGRQQVNVANTGLQQAQSLQQQIAQQQAGLTSQAQLALDPMGVAQQAIATAGSYAAPSPFPAVGQFFQNWANQNLAGQNNAMYTNYQNMYLNPFAQQAWNKQASFGGLPAQTITGQ